MSWTIARAERINGLRYEWTRHNDKSIEVRAYDGDELVAVDHGRTKDETVHCLVEKIYRKWSREVMEAQDWRCARCGERKPLQCHHKVHRSMGRRDDRKTNLEGLCIDCHEHEHKLKVPKQ